jgi:hypothetical protein
MDDEEKTCTWKPPDADDGVLTEKKRERYYWRFCLVFLVLSPLVFLGILQEEINISLQGIIFIVVAVIGFPLAVIWEIILGRISGFGATQRFFIKHPTVTKAFDINTDPASLPRIIVQRLQAENFNFRLINPGENEEHVAIIQFHKTKSAPVIKFMDHALNGEMAIFRKGAGASLKIRLTMEDTLIMDTGETKKLSDLCAHLATGAGEFASPNIPLLVNVTLSLCATGIILGIVGSFVPSMNMGWSFVFSMIGALSAMISCVMILLQPRALMGIRLSIMGIILGLIPLFAIITRIILKGIM